METLVGTVIGKIRRNQICSPLPDLLNIYLLNIFIQGNIQSSDGLHADTTFKLIQAFVTTSVFSARPCHCTVVTVSVVTSQVH